MQRSNGEKVINNMYCKEVTGFDLWLRLEAQNFTKNFFVFGQSDSFGRTWLSILFVHTSKKPKLPTLKKTEQTGQRMPTSHMATIPLRLIRGSHGATGESKNDCPKDVKNTLKGGGKSAHL